MRNVQLTIEGDALMVRVDVDQEVRRQLGAREEAAEIARTRWQESEWYLGEARAANDRLLQETERLAAQLAHAQDALEAAGRALDDGQRTLDLERAARRDAETELTALRQHGERRRTLRTRRPGGTVELHGSDGALLLRGSSRDVSGTGFGFATDQPIAGRSEPVQVRLYLVGAERPIEGTGRLAWQERDPATRECLGGCELLDMPADCLEAFERVVTGAG